MRKFKRLLAVGLIAVMTFNLAACDSTKDKDKKKVTAESLLEDIDAKDFENVALDMKLAIDLDLDLKQMMLDQGATEEQIQQAIDAGQVTEESLNMAIDINMDIKAENAGDYTYMTGKVDMSAMGIEEESDMKSYIDRTDEDKSITYDYDSEADEWYVEVEVEEEEKEEDKKDESIMDYIKEAEIADEDDDKYVLDVTVDIEKLLEEQSENVDDAMDSASDSLGSVLGDTDSLADSFKEYKVKVEVDKDDNHLLAVRIDLADLFKKAIESAAEESEESADYSKYIKINDCAIDLEFDEYGKVKVEIPEDVVENAKDSSNIGIDSEEDNDKDDVVVDDDKDDIIVDDGKEDESVADGDNNDSDSVVVNGNTFELCNYDGAPIATITIPEGFKLDTEYSSNWYVFLEDDDYNTIDVSSTPSIWVETIMNGEVYEADLDLYTRDEVAEMESVQTNQGTVRVFVNTWSFEENPQENYTQSIAYVLVKADGTMITVEAYADEIEAMGYTVETLIQTMLQ